MQIIMKKLIMNILLLKNLLLPNGHLDIFREGAVMSKGTTTSSGLVHSYFANIFGPPEYKDCP